ncbi:hypothetical protein [Exiguobacterium sp. R-17]|uniref:hypothetical protein n=1 Tax=Exiguobacterium sp. R-17 TaxID=3404054 RepID=UPI003CF19304
MKQMMNYVLSSDGNEFERGEIEAIGESVYEMTEYVVERLTPHFGYRLEFDFVDVSNEWTFSADDEEEGSHTIRFAPEGIHADKFGIEE